MLSRAELKAKAKESLNNKYGDAIVVIVLLGIITFIIESLTGGIADSLNLTDDSRSILISFISFLVSGLFTFGYMNFFLKISRNEDTEISDLWSKASMFVPYLVVTILVSLFTTLWTFLLIIPGIMAAFSYSMVYYVMLDNPDMSAMEAIKESKRIMDGHRMDLFVLHLSFIGWAILGIFTFGILYLWLIPYINVTTCNFYNNIKELA